MEQVRSVESVNNVPELVSIPKENLEEQNSIQLYAEMRKETVEILKRVEWVNNFEVDQEELIKYAEENILPLNNPFQGVLFQEPRDLLRLVIVNYSPINGRVMGDFLYFIRGVILQLSNNENQMIPSLDMLCEIFQGAGLHYKEPELSLGGADTMGKTIRKTNTKLTKAEEMKLAQESLAKQAIDKKNAIAKAKQQAAEAKEKAKLAQEKEELEAKVEATKSVIGRIGDKEYTADMNDPKAVFGAAIAMGRDLKKLEEAEAQAAEEQTGVVGIEQPVEPEVLEAGTSPIDLEERFQELKEAREKFVDSVESSIRDTREALGEIVTRIEATEESISEENALEEKKPMSLGKKIVIGGIAIATVVAGGYLASRIFKTSNTDESYTDY